MLRRGMMAAAAGGGGGGSDPNFSSVISLVHFDGVNGATAFTDVKGNVITNDGGATITTASGYGGSEAYFNGVGSGIRIALGAAGVLGSAWTIEAFLTPETFGDGCFFFNMEATSNQNYLYLQTNTNGSVAGFYIDGGIPASAAGVMVVGTRKHFAVCRDGGVLRVFVAGVLATSVTKTFPADPTGTVQFRPNRLHNLNFNGSRYQGKMDDIRITKGVARYTANFTPPTAPFPDS